jgi:hypothetical protein
LILEPQRAWIDVNELIVQPVVTAACRAKVVITDECSDQVEVLYSGADRHRNTSGVPWAGGEKAASATEELPFCSATYTGATRARLSQRDCFRDHVFYVLRKSGFGLPVDRQTTVSF